MDDIVSLIIENPKVMILSDEIYSQIIYPGYNFTSILDYPEIQDRVILLNGWSKTYAMTGWRIGYSIWPKKYKEISERLNINSFSCTNAPTQYAAIAALEGSQECVEKMVSAFNSRRELIVRELNHIEGFSCSDSQGAFYSMPSIKGTGLKSDKMEELLLYKLGITTVSGKSFGSFGEGYIRFSYANSEDNILTAMKRIKNFSKEVGWHNA